MKKYYTISISDRIDLHVNNSGFIFVLAGRTPENFITWNNWKYYYKPYLKDGLIKKVETFLNGFPDVFKSQEFYQGLNFQD